MPIPWVSVIGALPSHWGPWRDPAFVHVALDIARALKAARIAWASDVRHKADISGSRRRRQFGRSRSVPGRLTARRSPARSSAWTKASKDGVADTKPWMAAATSG